MTESNKNISVVKMLTHSIQNKVNRIANAAEITCDIKLLIPLITCLNNYELEREVAMNKYEHLPYAGDVCIDGDDPCQNCGEIDCICDLRDDEEDIAII